MNLNCCQQPHASGCVNITNVVCGEVGNVVARLHAQLCFSSIMTGCPVQIAAVPIEHV
jgi:hypothetical protein